MSDLLDQNSKPGDVVFKDEVVPVSQQNLLAAPTTANFLAVISQAAMDPSVDPQKMHGLLDVQERMMNKQAEINFNADFAKLQAELPRITKDAKIKHNTKIISTYATYENIDSVIRPLLIKHGFGLRFNSQPNGNTVLISATLSHRDGHSITDTIPLGYDTSGAKNNVQGVGSTIAYGKRYLVGMLLNLVFEGEDDDGGKADFVSMTEEQSAKIKDLLRETNSDVTKFLAHFQAKSVDEMDARSYDEAFNTLQTKKARMGAQS